MEFNGISILLLLLLGGSLLVLSPQVPTATAAEERPFAEAGLDQDSTVGESILLDANGSVSYSSEIVAYEWRIEAPDGSTRTPECDTCPLTEFEAEHAGVYVVQLTVTDGDGLTDTDQLYVTVDDRIGPEVTVTGEQDPVTDEAASYTAQFDTGDDPLSAVEWRIDDELLSETDLDSKSPDAITHDFDSEGEKTVEATVYDEAGRSDTHELPVTVDAPSADPASTRDGGIDGVVEGDEVVTGEQPLDADYRVADLDTDELDSLEWYDGDGRIGSGDELSHEWDPGTHELYAIATDGDQTERLTFEDSDEVIADPAPKVQLNVDREDGELIASVTATDEFDSLADASIHTDADTPVEVSPTGDDQSVFEDSFAIETPDDASEIDVRAVATDERGQSATDSTTQGEPEVVRSEFVNTPVDSYHERIDEERYTAVHELEIDLNGVDPGDVTPEVYDLEYESDLRQLSDFQTEYDRESDQVLIQSNWGGESPGTYTTRTELESNSNEYASFEVTPSPPEVDFEMLDPGQTSHNRGYLVHVDPEDSFDPDGTELSFSVGDRDRVYNGDETLGIEFSDSPKIVAKDGTGLTTEVGVDVFDYYSPEIESVKEISESPYEVNDEIVYEVRTERFQLAVPEHDPNIQVEVDGGEATVDSWRIVDPEPTAENTNDTAWQDATMYYSGTVRVDSDSFTSGSQPEMQVFNPDQPERTVNVQQIDTPDDLHPEPAGVEVDDVEYTVDTVLDEVSTTSATSREGLRSSGYSLDSTTRTTEAVEIEERHIETTTERETREFDSRSERDRFVSSRGGWSDAGTTTETVLTQETVWRDSHGGTGRFTGETREVVDYDRSSNQMHDADRITQYEYQKSTREQQTIYLASTTHTDTTVSWEPSHQVATIAEARSQTRGDDDLRVGDRIETTEWHLSKEVSEVRTLTSYEDPSHVTETSATVSGDVVEYPHYHGEFGPEATIIDDFEKEIELSGHRTDQELIDAVVGPSGSSGVCTSEYEVIC